MAQTKSLTQTWDERWQQIRETWFSNSRFYLLLVIFALLVGFAWGSLSRSVLDNNGIADAPWYSGFWQNFSTEMMGAIVTFALFELMLGARQRADDRAETEKREEQLRVFLDELNKRTEEQNRKALQANAVARLRQAKTPEERQPILDEMRILDLLSNVHLETIDLSGVNLNNANLVNSYLDEVNLSDASLESANFSDVILTRSKLANTNLQFADFSGADLTATNMTGANLQNARILHAQWKVTTLPDGTVWREGKDLDCFVNRLHPEYSNVLTQINLQRLNQGCRLISLIAFNNAFHPLPNERLDEETMLARVNERRAELGLEPLD